MNIKILVAALLVVGVASAESYDKAFNDAVSMFNIPGYTDMIKSATRSARAIYDLSVSDMNLNGKLEGIKRIIKREVPEEHQVLIRSFLDSILD